MFDLPPIGKRRLEISFTGEYLSSNRGLLLRKEAEKKVGIAKALSDCILDGRHPGYISHSHYDMTFQRVMQIAAGYEDANDCNILRNDTVLKMGIDRTPVSGVPLVSQPTMSRFENTPTNRELHRMAEAFLDNFMASYQVGPAVIILDADVHDGLRPDAQHTVQHTGNQQHNIAGDEDFQGTIPEDCHRSAGTEDQGSSRVPACLRRVYQYR